MTNPDELERAVERLEGTIARYPRESRVRTDKADLRLILSANREMREALVKACDAADDILVRVTAEVGRYVIEATDEDMVPMLAETNVALTAKMFRRLYDATDRSALSNQETTND